MGVIKNEVGRPSNKTKKIRMVLKLVGVLVVITLAVFLGYYIKDKKTNINIVNNKNNNTLKKQKISVSDADNIVKNIFNDSYMQDVLYYELENKDANVFNSDNYKSYIALSKTKLSSANKDYAKILGELGMTLDEYDRYSFTSGKYYGLYSTNEFIDYDDAKNMFDSLFLSGNLITNFVEPVQSVGAKYLYIKDYSTYVVLLEEMGDGLTYYLSNINDSYYVDDDLYINISFNSFIYDENNIYKIKFNDGEELKINEEELTEERLTELKDMYKDKLNNYELHLKKVNNDYKFIESKKTN